ncbi:hypothetical protein COV15_03380 [Candidatus Woesearchaeota archaeon CG10_big_fil_rev_8_21_14_0_10_34_12]|nr:MAG: hypothetical protein COV15_03380 [Candidatus Woesearchaeota archaeon CG10_big_fil_rev_8_21_14_0_10_34_12]
MCKYLNLSFAGVFRKAGSVAGTGAVGEEENCEICESKCKVCPPHPPKESGIKATKDNPEGICKKYPFSKPCTDYLNLISCGTCIDEDGDARNGREKFIPREDVGTDGNGINLNQYEKPIISDKNKDSINKDGIIDCYFFGPAGKDVKNPSNYEKNSAWGECKESLCTIVNPRNQKSISTCDADCETGWEIGKEKDGASINPGKTSKIVKLTHTCPEVYQSKKVPYKWYTNIKKDGSWGELFKTKEPDCSLEKGFHNIFTCWVLNGKKLEKGKEFHVSELQGKCRGPPFNYGGKAYFYLESDLAYIVSGAYCYCEKVIEEDISFEPYPETVMIMIREGGYVKTASLKPIIGSYLKSDEKSIGKSELLMFIHDWIKS